MQNNKSKTTSFIVKSLREVLEKQKLDNLFPQVSESISFLNQKMQAEKKALVISAVPLSENVLKKMQRFLNKKDLEMRNIIDPSVVGGFKIVIGDWVLDASIKHDLETIEKILS